MRRHACIWSFVILALLALAAVSGCGQSWTKVTELKGGTTSETTSRTEDFSVDGSVRVTYHTPGGSGTIVAYLMPSGAPDDLESRVDSGKVFELGGDDGQSATITDAHGTYYVSATGMFDPWSLSVETAP